MTRLFRQIAADRRGATIVEFALIAPVLLMTVMGIFDMGYNMYTSSILQGSIQKAARDSTIEGAADSAATINARVSTAVHKVVRSATLSFARKYYSNFADVSQPEDFTDGNTNGTCDNGEPFEDANGNGTWDADRGRTGFGGARDAVLYEVTVTYPRPFPVARLIGLPQNYSVVTRTVLRNQPFGLPGAATITTGNCT